MTAATTKGMMMGMKNEKMEMRKGMEPPSGIDNEGAEDMNMAGGNMNMKMKAPFPAPAPAGASSGGGKNGSKPKKWIGGINMQHGAFKAKAMKAGMDTAAFAAHVLKPGSTADTETKRQAVLARTLMGMNKK